VSDQHERLKLGEHAGLANAKAAASFLEDVGITLRYQPNDKLPIASMYQAVWRQTGKRPETEREAQRRAIVITNELIESGVAVEINCVADRVGLAHVSIVPALIALRRRNRRVDELELSETARRVLGFLGETPHPTAGQVRSHLGVPPKTWPNVADDALGELQRYLVIDRGATDVPETGMPYLSKDGIPYRIVDDVHAKHVQAAGRLSIESAATTVILAYLEGARFATKKQLAVMFKLCVSAAELDATLERLAADIELRKVDGKERVYRR
jgi:hypothetical protein